MGIILFAAVCPLLYLLLIMPRRPRRKALAPFKEVLFAHRGLHHNKGGSEPAAPENSLKAFQKAVTAGFGIELDVQLSKDDVPVVFHDEALKRVCGVKGKVRDYTYEELKQFSLFGTTEKIPKLADVLKLVDGRVPLIVEIKLESSDLAVCRFTDELLKRYQGTYCVESFNPLVVHWYKKNRREVVRGQLSDAFLKEGKHTTPLYFLLQHLLFNWLAKPDFIAYNHKYPYMLSRMLCRRLYQNTAAAWTIQSEAELLEARRHFDIFIFDSFLPEHK